MSNLEIDNLVTRRPTMRDVAAVVGLINMCAMVETGTLQTTVAQLRDGWLTLGFDLKTDAWLVTTSAGQLVGYAELWDRYPHVQPFIWVRVHPDYMNSALGFHLLALMEERAALAMLKAPSGTRVALCTAILCVDQSVRRLLFGHGFKMARRFWRMRRDVDAPLSLPQGSHEIALPAYIARDEQAMCRYDVFEKELRAGRAMETLPYAS